MEINMLYVCVCFNKRVIAIKPTRLKGVRESPLNGIHPIVNRNLSQSTPALGKKKKKTERGEEEEKKICV